MVLQLVIAVFMYLYVGCYSMDLFSFQLAGFNAMGYNVQVKKGTHPLVLPSVLYNLGEGYDPATGVFTAPTDGNYNWVIAAKEPGDSEVYIDFYHNTQKVNRIILNVTLTSVVGDLTVVADNFSVKKGDKVYLTTQADQNTKNGLFAEFIGDEVPFTK